MHITFKLQQLQLQLPNLNLKRTLKLKNIIRKKNSTYSSKLKRERELKKKNQSRRRRVCGDFRFMERNLKRNRSFPHAFSSFRCLCRSTLQQSPLFSSSNHFFLMKKQTEVDCTQPSIIENFQSRRLEQFDRRFVIVLESQKA